MKVEMVSATESAEEVMPVYAARIGAPRLVYSDWATLSQAMNQGGDLAVTTTGRALTWTLVF